jgi:hypothetical protein
MNKLSCIEVVFMVLYGVAMIVAILTGLRHLRKELQ